MFEGSRNPHAYAKGARGTGLSQEGRTNRVELRVEHWDRCIWHGYAMFGSRICERGMYSKNGSFRLDFAPCIRPCGHARTPVEVAHYGDVYVKKERTG